MSPNREMKSKGNLPIWSGTSEDPTEWEDYKYTIYGYCVERGMSVLLKKNYIRPKDPEEDRERQDALMGVLLQTTRDAAGKLVRSFIDEGDGVGAWRALITRYGNDSPELKQAKQIELIQKVVDIRCKDRVAYCIQQYAFCTVSVLQNRIYICSMFGLRKEPKE